MITSTESSINVTEASRVIISYAPATPSARSKTMAATFSTLASVCIICCVVVMVLWARRYQRRQRKLKRMSAFVSFLFPTIKFLNINQLNQRLRNACTFSGLV